MPKRRRTALALLAATLLAPSTAIIPASPAASNGPGILDTSLFDRDLPECDFTGVDRGAIGGPGLQCYLKSFSQSEGEGACAPGCCCDTKASSERTVRLISAPGGCGSMYETGEDNKVLKLILMPWSVTSIGVGGTCAETTDEICGRFAPGCWMPAVKKVAVDEAEARAKSEEEKRRRSSAQVEDDGKEVAEMGITGKEVAAIIVSTIVIAVILVFVIVRFMVLPWFRGELDEFDCSEIM